MTVLYAESKAGNNMRQPMTLKLRVEVAAKLYRAEWFGIIADACPFKLVLQKTVIKACIVSD